jgi:hypothetical protein
MTLVVTGGFVAAYVAIFVAAFLAIAVVTPKPVLSPVAFMNLFEQFRQASWDGWRGVLSGLTERTRELWAIVGRGSGKSIIAAVLACCFAARAYRRMAGETIYIGGFAPTRAQATVTYRYVVGLMRSVPVLAALWPASARRLRRPSTPARTARATRPRPHWPSCLNCAGMPPRPARSDAFRARSTSSRRFPRPARASAWRTRLTSSGRFSVNLRMFDPRAAIRTGLVNSRDRSLRLCVSHTACTWPLSRDKQTTARVTRTRQAVVTAGETSGARTGQAPSGSSR